MRINISHNDLLFMSIFEKRPAFTLCANTQMLHIPTAEIVELVSASSDFECTLKIKRNGQLIRGHISEITAPLTQEAFDSISENFDEFLYHKDYQMEADYESR